MKWTQAAHHRTVYCAISRASSAQTQRRSGARRPGECDFARDTCLRQPIHPLNVLCAVSSCPRRTGVWPSALPRRGTPRPRGLFGRDAASEGRRRTRLQPPVRATGTRAAQAVNLGDAGQPRYHGAQTGMPPPRAYYRDRRRSRYCQISPCALSLLAAMTVPLLACSTVNQAALAQRLDEDRQTVSCCVSGRTPAIMRSEGGKRIFTFVLVIGPAPASAHEGARQHPITGMAIADDAAHGPPQPTVVAGSRGARAIYLHGRPRRSR